MQNLLIKSEIASKTPIWPATPPKATALTANAKITTVGTPNSCLSISFVSGFDVNRFTSEIGIWHENIIVGSSK